MSRKTTRETTITNTGRMFPMESGSKIIKRPWASAADPAKNDKKCEKLVKNQYIDKSATLNIESV